MILCRVKGSVVGTAKHPCFAGHKILIVQPVDASGASKGKSFLALDGVQAGVGDRVLVVDEGGSARLVVGDETGMTIRTAVAAIVDAVDLAAVEDSR